MNETAYMKLSLRERLQARAPTPTYSAPGPIFTKPSPNPQRTERLFHIEAGHGLRVVPVSDIIKLDHRGWFVDQYEDETIQAHIIRLPKGRGFLCAASDPWNDDAFTVLNDAPEPAHPGGVLCQPFRYRESAGIADQAEREAARQAEQFTERLAEDYRDDAEHQTALNDYEEALHPLEKAKEEAEARRDEAEAERAQAQAEAFALVETAAGFGTLTTPQEREQIGEAIAAAQARADQAEAERDDAQEDAGDIQDQIDNLEEPTVPHFHYFGKAKR